MHTKQEDGVIKTRTSFCGNMYVFFKKDVHVFLNPLPYSNRILRAGSMRVIK